jgi:hypothetical protein
VPVMMIALCGSFSEDTGPVVVCNLETCLFARSRPDHTPVAAETAAVTIGALVGSQSL